MLATVRRAASRHLRAPCRHLSTDVTPAFTHGPHLGALASAGRTELQSLQPAPVKALPVINPVFMELTSLIPPAEDASPASDKVVAMDPTVFGHPIRRDILHLCVVHHLDSLRQGSASKKTRGEVRGSGRKIRQQKGTGHARLGDGQSPMLRGGGRAFAPKPRDFSTKLPRKVIEMGMRVALSAKVKEQSLGVVESLEWPTIKTRDLVKRLDELNWRKTLFVTGKSVVPKGLLKSSGNIQKVDAVTVGEVDVYTMVKWPRVVMDVEAVEWYERRLGKERPTVELALDVADVPA